MLVLGDAHADDPEKKAALLAAYDNSTADVALHVGDLLHYDLPLPTWFVAGNNEDFDVIDALRRGEQVDSVENAHLLASTVTDVDGLHVAGLSGNFAPTQYEKSRGELAGDRRRHFVRDDVERAKQLTDVDVFLSHEAPTDLIYRGYDVGCEHVDDILAAVEPKLCLVGHHHQHAEETVGDTRVVSLAPTWDSHYHLDADNLSLDRHTQ